MIYRTEHPKPQFERANWLTLNGLWDFEPDYSNSGIERKLFLEESEFSQKINVPFCPESKLSTIGNTDFYSAVWYKKEINLTQNDLSGRVFLHFGAVDYEAEVYINSVKCASHKGGYVSFKVDITDFVRPGKNIITLRALDNTRDRMVPSGKQSDSYNSYGCFYTRTTGIWQTVWLEFVPESYIESVRYIADTDNVSVGIFAKLKGKGTFSVKAYFKGEFMGQASVSNASGDIAVNVKLLQKHLWHVGEGNLYDLVLSFNTDVVKSYFGLRKIRLDGKKFLINEKSVFQRLVLDQGFYPDGIYTAPSDDELLADIKRAMDMGFNGARLHEKIFEERFLYHCDKMGYIVWAEYPNWGLDHTDPIGIYSVLPEWLEEIERDFNHPSIIGWCPFNETWDIAGRKQYDDLLSTVYKVTKVADPTRPCIDTSGNFHTITDIYDVHDYEQDPKIFANHYEPIGKTNKLQFGQELGNRQQYDGILPFFVSEYGGIAWSNKEEGWGYGQAPKTKEEFLQRLKGLTDVLLSNENMFGFCYTQLTDVEQEQNGLYTYDREAKFPSRIIREIFSKKAAIED